MKNRKYIALMSAACLAFTGAAAEMPVLTVSAATECYDEQGVRYSLDTSKTPPEAHVIGVKTSVTEITIPETVTLYEAGVPYEAKVTALGTSVFEKSILKKNILEKITIKAPITQIPDSAFSNCKTLKEIVLPDTVTEIGTHAFAETLFTDLSFLQNTSLKKIGSFAFSSCDELTSAIIPDTVELIEEDAFYSCSNLVNVHLPKNEKYTYISAGLFMFCTKLSAIEIPDTVTTLQVNAFKECAALTEIRIPESVSCIASGVFDECKSLTDVYIYNPGCEIRGTNMFGYKALVKREIYIHGLKGSTAQTFVEDYSPDGAKSGGHDYGYRFVELEAQPAKPAQGDFDGSGKVDTADAVLFCRFLSEDAAADYMAFTPELADLDGDGLLTLLDVRRLLMLL